MEFLKFKWVSGYFWPNLLLFPSNIKFNAGIFTSHNNKVKQKIWLPQKRCHILQQKSYFVETKNKSKWKLIYRKKLHTWNKKSSKGTSKFEQMTREVFTTTHILKIKLISSLKLFYILWKTHFSHIYPPCTKSSVENVNDANNYLSKNTSGKHNSFRLITWSQLLIPLDGSFERKCFIEIFSYKNIYILISV